MSRRHNFDSRCPGCHMNVTLCICELVPKLEPRARLSLLIHYREARKPTNTGTLAARCLARSEVGVVGDRARPLALPLIRPGELGLLLFPDPDAVPIAHYAGSDQPLVLVVPDGSWRQAGKMRKRVPGLDALACVTIPPGRTNYRLRAENRIGGLATLEAIAQAFGILEGDRGPAIEAAMLAVFRVMVERTLWLRGALRDSDVTGGVPADARPKIAENGRK